MLPVSQCWDELYRIFVIRGNERREMANFLRLIKIMQCVDETDNQFI